MTVLIFAEVIKPREIKTLAELIEMNVTNGMGYNDYINRFKDLLPIYHSNEKKFLEEIERKYSTEEGLQKHLEKMERKNPSTSFREQHNLPLNIPLETKVLHSESNSDSGKITINFTPQTHIKFIKAFSYEIEKPLQELTKKYRLSKKFQPLFQKLQDKGLSKRSIEELIETIGTKKGKATKLKFLLEAINNNYSNLCSFRSYEGLKILKDTISEVEQLREELSSVSYDKGFYLIHQLGSKERVVNLFYKIRDLEEGDIGKAYYLLLYFAEISENSGHTIEALMEMYYHNKKKNEEPYLEDDYED